MTTRVPNAWERRITFASLIFHLVDRYARDRRTAGPSPPVRGPVRYRIVATEVGGVRTGLDEPLTMHMDRNASGYDLWFGEAVTARGRCFRVPHPPPSLVIEIDPARYQLIETVVSALPIPDAPQQFDLEPGYAYEFPLATTVPGGTGPTLLRGTVRTPSGRGIADASIRVVPAPANQPPPNPSYTTDPTGQWVLPFDDAVASTNAATLEVALLGQAPLAVSEITIAAGATASVRQASLAGTATGASGSPLQGVVVTTDAVPGISTASDEDGRWELWLPIDQFLPSNGPQAATVTATSPQGPALNANVQIRPRVTTQVDPFVFP